MYILNELRRKKLIEAEVEIEAFKEAHNFRNDALIYAMIFDVKQFPKKEDVKDFLKDRTYHDYFISENAGITFDVTLLNTANLDLDKTVAITIRSGVEVFAAPYRSLEELMFSDKNTENKLLENVPDIIKVATVAKGTHPSYGKVEITKDMLESFEKNFNDRVTGVDLAINEDHKKNEAFGWFKEVFLSEDGLDLFAKVKWNKKGTVSLNEGEYRYFSPEFRQNFIHNLSGKEYGPTLVGGALTNYPFLKMDAITNLNEGEQDMELKEQVVELSAKNATLEAKLVELNEKNQKAVAEVVALNEKLAALEAEKAEAARIKKNEELFLAKKINKAQLVALNEGKDLFEVLSLNTDINFDERGETGRKDTIELSEAEKKAAEALGIPAELMIAHRM